MITIIDGVMTIDTPNVTSLKGKETEFDGNVVIEQMLTANSGITFPDGSIQTTASGTIAQGVVGNLVKIGANGSMIDAQESIETIESKIDDKIEVVSKKISNKYYHMIGEIFFSSRLTTKFGAVLCNGAEYSADDYSTNNVDGENIWELLTSGGGVVANHHI